MKTQEYDVTYWPIGKPGRSHEMKDVVEAHGKEDALNVARRKFGVNHSFKIKRKNYHWTGEGVVTLMKRRWASEKSA